MISVLIAAAGSGLRLGAGESKALVRIAGRPMLLWSIDALAEVRDVEEILVAAPPNAVDRFDALRREHRCPAWRAVVAGGATRVDSVRNLLATARGDRILVHDAARPCATALWVSALINELGDDLAGVPALPVRDTLKRGEGGLVVETISREGLYSIQTPQIFDADLLRHAHRRAAASGAGATDDAALVERVGGRVRLLTGESSNVKITYPDDVALATRLLEERVT